MLTATTFVLESFKNAEISKSQKCEKDFLAGKYKNIFLLKMTQNTLKCKNQPNFFLDKMAAIVVIFDFFGTKIHLGFPFNICYKCSSLTMDLLATISVI